MAYKGRPVTFTRTVGMKGQALYRSGVVYVDVQLTTEIELECSRCLKPVSYPVRLERSMEIHEEPETGFEGVLLDGFSYEHGVDQLELLPYFEKLVATSLESKPLCRPDCKGLCPTCGRDLNQEACACAQERSIDPRLEKLKELLT